MSANRNEIDPRAAGAAIALFVAVALVLGFVFWVATLIGASFTSVLETFGWWIGFGVVAGGVAYFVRCRYWSIGFAYACCAWPSAWGVLDSIAAGGHEGEGGPIDFSQYSTSMINSGWVKWGVLAILVVALVVAFYRERDD
jgi:hypothetical protein